MQFYTKATKEDYAELGQWRLRLKNRFLRNHPVISGVVLLAAFLFAFVMGVIAKQQPSGYLAFLGKQITVLAGAGIWLVLFIPFAARIMQKAYIQVNTKSLYG